MHLKTDQDFKFFANPRNWSFYNSKRAGNGNGGIQTIKSKTQIMAFLNSNTTR